MFNLPMGWDWRPPNRTLPDAARALFKKNIREYSLIKSHM